MKNKLFIFCLMNIVILNNIYSQNFTGEITFKITVIPKNDSIKGDEISQIEDWDLMKYQITKGFYKANYYKNNNYVYSYTYHESSKRMYDDQVDCEYITFRDSRKSNAKFLGATLLKDSTIEVLGHKCYLLKVKSDKSTSREYFSDDIKVNAEDFAGHLVGNWYQKLQLVNGSIPLKSITEYATYYSIQEAVKIEERILDKTEFDLSKNKPLAASYTALDKEAQLIEPTKKQINCYLKKVNSVSKPNGLPFKSYVSFLLTDNAEIKYVSPLNKDELGLYKVSIDVVKTCNIEYIPGEIEGKPINSMVVFPVEFKR